VVDPLVTDSLPGPHRDPFDRMLAAQALLIGTGNAEPLARAFDSMDLMYENHAAREDTNPGNSPVFGRAIREGR
jgi:hypothetical protein